MRGVTCGEPLASMATSMQHEATTGPNARMAGKCLDRQRVRTIVVHAMKSIVSKPLLMGTCPLIHHLSASSRLM